MNIHKNARTTPNMRALIGGRHQAGETPRAIAGARRFARARQEMAPAPRKRRRRWPPRPDQPAVWKIAREAGLSLGPVARIAKAKGLSRLSVRDHRIAIIRDEKKQPGEMIHIDIKKLGRSQGTGHRSTGDRTRQSAPRSRKQDGKGFRISPSGGRRSLASGLF